MSESTISGSTLVCLTSPSPDPDTLETIERIADEHQLIVYELTVGEARTDIDWTDVALGVAIGGDGTFLEGVRLFSPHDTPMLAVNDGSLGFLARIHPRDLRPALKASLEGAVSIIDREMLAVTGGGIDGVGINDVMVEPLSPENPTDRKIARVHAYVDNEYVGQFDGSGLAVSTPTGSTAVALSAGGPIHYPNANSSLQLTPLHTHNIGVRPVIVDGDSTITLIPEDEMDVLVDGGRDQTVIEPMSEICVTGADRTAKVVRTEFDETFFDALSGKLGWGVRGVDEPGPR